MISKSIYRKFFKHLKRTYPINKKPLITLDLSSKERVQYNGEALYGIVSFTHTQASIQVAISSNPMLTLKIIGHEYRHIMQRFNMNWLPGGPTHTKRETDAQLFGHAEAWSWVRAEGLV
jgi:hypothetical protein